jgi:peptide/nickel transport system substrate-binding protein
MQKTIRTYLMLVLVMALFLTVTGLSVAQDEKVVTVGLAAEPGQIDPRNYTFTPSTFAVAYQIWEPLVYHDTTIDELIPGLAESWEILDEDSYQFNLRQGVTWHDGEPFNADDVVWSLTRTANRIAEYALDPAMPVEVIDDYTVIVNTDGPQGPFLKQNLALNIRILPEHILEPFYAEARAAEYEPTTDADGNEVSAEQVRDDTLFSIDRGDDWSEPEYVGTGPFKFGSWERGTEIVLEANEDYWGGAPNADKVVFRWVEEDTSRVIGLEAGDFDLILGVPENDVERLQGMGDIEVLISPGLNYHMLTMNQSVPALSDVRVRQAIAYAIDKDEITSLYGDLATRDCAPLSVNSGFYNTEVNCYDHDPDRARELLEEVGWDSSQTLQLKIISDMSDEALLIQQYLGDVGINIEIQEVDAGSYYSEVRGGESELAMYDWGNVVDPDHMYWVYTSTILGGRVFSYNNPAVDELLLQGQQTADVAQRRELYNEAQRIIVNEDTVGVNIYSSAELRAYRSDRLTGMEPMPRPTDVFYWLRSVDVAG